VKLSIGDCEKHLSLQPPRSSHSRTQILNFILFSKPRLRKDENSYGFYAMSKMRSETQSKKILKEIPIFREIPIMRDIPIMREFPILREIPIFREIPIMRDIPIMRKSPSLGKSPSWGKSQCRGKSHLARKAHLSLSLTSYCGLLTYYYYYRHTHNKNTVLYNIYWNLLIWFTERVTPHCIHKHCKK